MEEEWVEKQEQKDYKEILLYVLKSKYCYHFFTDVDFESFKTAHNFSEIQL